MAEWHEITNRECMVYTPMQMHLSIQVMLHRRFDRVAGGWSRRWQTAERFSDSGLLITLHGRETAIAPVSPTLRPGR